MKMNIRIVFKSDLDDSHRLSSPLLVDRKICIGDTSMFFHIEVMNRYVGLSDIVPMARTVCDAIVDVTIGQAEKNGHAVSCRKGCSACCRYLVPLSIAEVCRLQHEFLQVPDDRRIPILKSCVESASAILAHGPSDIEDKADNLPALSEWYIGLNIQCPFLLNGLCSLYEMRPLACREYYVSSRPALCQIGSTDTPNIVRLPVSTLESLGTLIERLEPAQVQAVMLPLALLETDEITRRSGQTLPAVEMVNQFFDIIEEAVAKNAELETAKDYTCS